MQSGKSVCKARREGQTKNKNKKQKQKKTLLIHCQKMKKKKKKLKKNNERPKVFQSVENERVANITIHYIVVSHRYSHQFRSARHFGLI
jgi:hypothetical protein